MTRPLEGIKVVDFAGHGFVPSAAAALADWGAEVVKIERPGGDPLRAVLRDGLVADADGTDYIWEFFNRNKRGIALDVETAAGREIFERLVKWADVYITNQLPRVRRKLRTEPADLLALNPRLVYAKGHGQGQRGPDAEAGGFDSVSFWSRGGVGHMLSSPDAELPVGQRAGQGDIPSGMFLAAGICAALVGVSRTGEGVVVDTSLLGSAMWTLAPDLAYTSIAGREPPRTRADPAARSPLVGQHQTADGRWLSLSMLDEDRYWAPTCRALGLHGLIEQFPDAATRSANRLHIYQQISTSIAGGTHERSRRRAARRGVHLLLLRVAARGARRRGGDRQRLCGARIRSTPRCDSARPLPSSTTNCRASAGPHRRSASTRARSSPSSGTRPTRSRASSTTASSRRQARAHPLGLSVRPQLRDAARESLERVWHLGQDDEIDVDVGRGGAGREEERVVEEVITRADADETRGQSPKVGERRRDLRRATFLLGHPREEALTHEVDAVGAEDVEAVSARACHADWANDPSRTRRT